jgi:leucyl aminopeptidase
LNAEQPRPTYLGTTADPASLDVDVLFIPMWTESDALNDAPWLHEATGGGVRRARESGEYRVKLFETFVTPVVGPGCKARRVAIVGAGEIAEAGAERLRRIGATCGLAAKRFGAQSLAVVVRRVGDAVGAAQHLMDGCVSAQFDGGTYKTKADQPVRSANAITIAAPAGQNTGAIAAAVERGVITAESAIVTRGLANEPSNVLTPEEFANRVSAIASGAGLSVDVLDEHRIKELKMELLLGVARGSAVPARLVVIRHEPKGAPATPVIGLIGKGVTFDTGGVSIKPAEGMERMKSDMSGGAAVAGAMLALARLGGPFRTIGIIPLAENMVGGRAIRPGDVLRGASGKTVEVINTDAEGRLILADALWYAGQLGCTHLIDVATLTGACSVALGRHVSGLMGEPVPWVETVRQAANRGGDRVWPLPIYEEAREQLRSEIADMMNVGGRPGGAITAAAFLREFSGGLPWAHLDIAGTAWAESKEPYQSKGATGVAVRTLIELAYSGGGPEGFAG